MVHEKRKVRVQGRVRVRQRGRGGGETNYTTDRNDERCEQHEKVSGERTKDSPVYTLEE
jgi:hypothetical protein